MGVAAMLPDPKIAIDGDARRPTDAKPGGASTASNRSYRVLMIAPTSFFADYGCHVRILEEARVLQSLGHQVTVVTYRNGKDVAGLDIQRTLPIPWRQEYEVGSSRHKIVFDALLSLKTFGLLVRGKFDLVHAHLHEGALIGLVLGGALGIPTVFDFQGSMTEEMIDHHFLRRNSRLHGLVRAGETWIDRRSRVILTNSSNARRVLVNDFGCDADRLQALPDCVNNGVFRPAAEYAQEDLAVLRSQLGIPADHKVLVYLGLLAEYQGTTHLLQAMQLLLARRQNVTLLLMGFPGEDVYRQKACDLGVEAHVILTGRVPYGDAPRHLALGDAAVSPKLSLTEGAGKLLNYMAVGLPTVSFDTPVAREYLGGHGLLAVRGDVESLAAQLESALFDEAVAHPLGRQLRQRAVEHYDWSAAGEQIVQIYAELLGDVASTSTPARLGQRQRQSL